MLTLQQVWLVSFVATVALDVVSGLIVGVVFSLMTLVYKVLNLHHTFLRLTGVIFS